MDLKKVTIIYNKQDNIVEIDCSKDDIIPSYAYYLFKALGIPLTCKIKFTDYTTGDTIDYYKRKEIAKF